MQREDSIIEDYTYISYGLNDVFKNTLVIRSAYNEVMVNIFAVEENMLNVTRGAYMSVKNKWIPPGEELEH